VLELVKNAHDVMESPDRDDHDRAVLLEAVRTRLVSRAESDPTLVTFERHPRMFSLVVEYLDYTADQRVAA
jgi:hypothetical protein